VIGVYELSYVATGWNPGNGTTDHAPDPTSIETPDPSSVINAVIPALKTVLLSSGGAALLAMVGVIALMKGWQWYTAMFRKPRQLTLF
jgi:hypothetical protein